MKERNITNIILLYIFTLGFYIYYWFVVTKIELNQQGAQIPTAWLLLIPLVNFYWIWLYFEAAETISSEKINGPVMFVLSLLNFSIIAMALSQIEYNRIQTISGVKHT